MLQRLKRDNVTLELIAEENAGWELMNKLDEYLTGGLSCIFQPIARANNPRVLPKLEEGSFDAQPLDYPSWEALHRAVRSGKAINWEKVQPEYKDFCVLNGYDPEKPLTWIALSLIHI